MSPRRLRQFEAALSIGTLATLLGMAIIAAALVGQILERYAG